MKIKSFFYLFFLLLIAACSQSSTEEAAQKTSASKENTQQTTYTVATQKDFAPFVYRGTDGQLTGFDIDIIKAIGEKEHFTLQFNAMDRPQMFESIQAGKFDIVAASVTITDERKEKMDFSDPYFESHQMVLLNKNTPEIHSFADLANLRIAVKPNTTSDAILQSIISKKDNIVHVDTAFLGAKSTILNETAGYMSDSGVILYYAKENKDQQLKTFTDPNYPAENYGFALTKGRNDDLRAKINQGLKTIREDGTYQAIVDKWFGQ